MEIRCTGCEALYEVERDLVPSGGGQLVCADCGTSMPVAGTKPGRGKGEAGKRRRPSTRTTVLSARRVTVRTSSGAADGWGGLGSYSLSTRTGLWLRQAGQAGRIRLVVLLLLAVTLAGLWAVSRGGDSLAGMAGSLGLAGSDPRVETLTGEAAAAMKGFTHNDLAGAERHLVEALRIDGGSLPTRSLRAINFLLLAELYAGRVDAALASIDAIRARTRQATEGEERDRLLLASAEATRNVSALGAKRQNFLDLARREVTLASEAGADNPLVRRSRAMLLRLEGEQEEAGRIIAGLRRESPDDPAVIYEEGMIELGRAGGDPAAARNLFERAARLDPSDHRYGWRLATLPPAGTPNRLAEAADH